MAQTGANWRNPPERTVRLIRDLGGLAPLSNTTKIRQKMCQHASDSALISAETLEPKFSITFLSKENYSL